MTRVFGRIRVRVSPQGCKAAIGPCCRVAPDPKPGVSAWRFASLASYRSRHCLVAAGLLQPRRLRIGGSQRDAGRVMWFHHLPIGRLAYAVGRVGEMASAPTLSRDKTHSAVACYRLRRRCSSSEPAALAATAGYSTRLSWALSSPLATPKRTNVVLDSGALVCRGSYSIPLVRCSARAMQLPKRACAHRGTGVFDELGVRADARVHPST